MNEFIVNVTPEERKQCMWKAATANRKRQIIGEDGLHTYVWPKPKLDWQDVYLVMHYFEGCCLWCGKQVWLDGTLDHFIRIADGGTNLTSNLVWACSSCNSKGNRREPPWNIDDGTRGKELPLHSAPLVTAWQW